MSYMIPSIDYNYSMFSIFYIFKTKKYEKNTLNDPAYN